MITKVRYVYNSYTLSCGCCSESDSYIEIEKEGSYEEHSCFKLIGNDQDLREYLAEAYPDLVEYEVDPDSEWY